MVFLAVAALIAEPILVVDAQVIGSRVDGRWKTPDAGFAKRHKPQAFYPFGLGNVDARPNFYGLEAESSDGPVYLASERAERDLGAMLGGVAPKVPRLVHTLPSSPVYETICRKFLAKRGVRVAKAHVTRVLKVDLDGDGTDEVLVEAISGEISIHAVKGSYSFVLLRSLKAGRVIETPLDFYPSKPGGVMLTTATRGIADLDGDGRMEIVVSDTGIDENGAVLWGYRAGRATKLLENGSGV